MQYFQKGVDISHNSTAAGHFLSTWSEFLFYFQLICIEISHNAETPNGA